MPRPQVLVIDDDPTHADIIAHAIEGFCDVTIPMSAGEVVRELDQAPTRYALVITDYYLTGWKYDPKLPVGEEPPHTAEDVIRRLRSNNPSVPEIYVVSSYPEDSPIRKLQREFRVPIASYNSVADPLFRLTVENLVARWSPPVRGAAQAGTALTR